MKESRVHTTERRKESKIRRGEWKDWTELVSVLSSVLRLFSQACFLFAVGQVLVGWFRQFCKHLLFPHAWPCSTRVNNYACPFVSLKLC